MYEYNSTSSLLSIQIKECHNNLARTGGKEAINRGDLVAVVTWRQRRQEGEEEENGRGEVGGDC